MRTALLLSCLMSCCLLCVFPSGADDTERNVSESPPEILSLRLPNTPQPDYEAIVPAQISGQVLLQTEGRTAPAPGVSITDGFTVVRTDEHGRYSLKPHLQAVFIYLTRPSGFDVQGHWYQPLAAEVNFRLTAASQSEEEFIFIHVTDTHISQNPRSLQGLSQFVREVNALEPSPRFVVNSGDLLDLHKALISSPESGHRDFRNYVGIMNHLTMPHYNVAGDHTDSAYRITQFPRGDHRCGKPLYWEYLGPNFFSFEYGRIHFVSVDFGYHLGQRQISVNGKPLEYPTNRVQPPHVEWMRQDMAHRGRRTFVVTTSEADLENHCPDFLDMARKHDIRLQLVGDNHVVASKSRPVPWRSGGALAGCWWNPRTEHQCPDLSPQGYLIYRVKGETLEHFYKGLDRRIEIISHRQGALLQGEVTLTAHVVQPASDESLSCSFDGDSWQPMRETRRPFYRAEYQVTVNSRSLPGGILNFHVKHSSGEVRTRQFVVASSDRPAPLETAARLTFTVGAASSWTQVKAPDKPTAVLWNGQVIGELAPAAGRDYSFVIPAVRLRDVNVLSFDFEKSGDSMTLSSPQLSVGDITYSDPRDAALRRVKAAHWGTAAVDWGGFIVGRAAPPDESPFHRRQNVFCFVLSDTD